MRPGVLVIATFIATLPLPAFAADQDPLEEADRAYFKALGAAELQYRKALAEALARADKIELFLLDFEHQPSPDANRDLVWDKRVPDGFFPIIPYGAQSRILKRKTLSAEERRQLLPPLQKAVAVEENTSGALCHFPIHGIRASVGGEVIFQTSLCWECNNFYLKYPTNAAWTGISVRELHDVCERLMPIPKNELDRFNAKYGR